MKKAMIRMGILSILTGLSLTACSGSTPASSSTAAASSLTPKGDSTSAAQSSYEDEWQAARAALLAELRQEAQDHGCMAGIFYMGETDTGNLYNVLKDNSAFLWDIVYDIPEERWITTPGGVEAYCIFPVDPNASVAVNQWVCDESTGFVGKPGEVLYRSDSGDPILLLCNVNDAVPDTEVVIVDNNGNDLSFNPRMAMAGYEYRYGTIASMPGVWDFTLSETDNDVASSDGMEGQDTETPGPLLLEGNWQAVTLVSKYGTDSIAPDYADTLTFLPWDDAEGNLLPYQVTYVAMGDVVVEDGEVMFEEGSMDKDYHANEEWYATFTDNEFNVRYSLTLEGPDTLALRRTLPNEIKNQPETLYFTRTDGMG